MALAKGMLPCWAAFSQTWGGPPSVSRLAGEAHPAVLTGAADRRQPCSDQTGLSVSGAAIALAAAGRATKAKGARTKLKKKRPAGLGFSTPRVSDEPVTGYDTGPKLLEILKYPHPALRRPNAEVTDFGPKLRQLSENLFRTMYAKDNGCGLAAPQCGVNLRVMVYNYQRIAGEGRKPEGEVVFVNPRITAHSEEKCEMLEGCLSFPNFGAPVVRPAWVEVQAVDLDGNPYTKRLEGDEARVFQHEYDHLDGIVYIDLVADENKKEIAANLKKLVNDYAAGGGKDPRP